LGSSVSSIMAEKTLPPNQRRGRERKCGPSHGPVMGALQKGGPGPGGGGGGGGGV